MPSTLLLILLPMFVGFALPKNVRLNKITNQLLNYIVFAILLLIGIELAAIDELHATLLAIVRYLLPLLGLTLGFGLLSLVLYDNYLHHKSSTNSSGTLNHGAQTGWQAGVLQLGLLGVGVIIGQVTGYTPPDNATTVLLMGLLLAVGIVLKNSDVSIRRALINKHGLQLTVIFTGATLLGGAFFAWWHHLPIWHGLALAAGFGWYSLSATIITDAYGALWGSVALLNDLSREILALLLIPYLGRHTPSAAIGLAGVTGLDFTLPTLQRTLGVHYLPTIVSFGLLTNIIAPILLVLFATLGQSA